MNHIKDVLDGASAALAIGLLFKLIPAIAGLLSIVWYCIRLYDRFKGKKNGNE